MTEEDPSELYGTSHPEGLDIIKLMLGKSAVNKRLAEWSDFLQPLCLAARRLLN